MVMQKPQSQLCVSHWYVETYALVLLNHQGLLVFVDVSRLFNVVVNVVNLPLLTWKDSFY